MFNNWKNELAKASELEALRIRVSFGISILTAILIAVVVPLRHAINPMPFLQLTQCALSLILSIFGSTAILIQPQAAAGRYGALAAAILFPFSAGFFSGGLDAPIMPIVLLFPLIAGFVAGRSAALVFFIISAFTVTLFFYLKKHGMLPPSALTSEDLVNRTKFINIMTLLVMAFGLAFLYDKMRTFELKARQFIDAERTNKIRIAKLASLGEMAAGLAHEINNPLGIVAGSVRSLAKFSGDSKKLAENIELIEKSTSRIVKIVQSLKKFSRSSDRVEFSNKNLNDILQEALTLTDAKSKRHATNVQTAVESNGPIFCNEIEIEQVLVNLIANAIDAVKKTDEKWVLVAIKENDTHVVLHVKDSGLGIIPAVQEKLFQPFFTTKDVGEGTGLGLSIVKGILDEHKASIELLSSEKNTCFEIKFPKAQTKI